MNNSNFWYYVIFAIVLLHVIVGFIYIVIKLSPKKKRKEKKRKEKKRKENKS